MNNDPDNLSASPNNHTESAAMINRFGPVSPGERIMEIDVLRGVALLGILIINIDFFALPGAILFDPRISGGFEGASFLVWKIDAVFFLQKMMSLFSMLFGAGIILIAERIEAAGKSPGKIFYRRTLWLLVLGLIHGYLIWVGDILFNYAVCALLLFLFRRCSPRLLIIMAVVMFLIGGIIMGGSGVMFGYLREEAHKAEQTLAEGGTIASYQEGMMASWHEIVRGFVPPPEEIEAEIEGYKGGYIDNFKTRLPDTVMMQTQALFFMMFWRVAALMFLGMALMKLGIINGKRSIKFYAVLAVIGCAVGFPLTIYNLNSELKSGFDIVEMFTINVHISTIGNTLIALGYIGVVMLVCKLKLLKWLTRRLAAVGRMALTNYLMHSIICTTIFYGFGLGLFNEFNRFGLIWFVFGIWILQLIVSPVWLKYYRFGPAEWLWRWLTYWRKQPMKIS